MKPVESPLERRGYQGDAVGAVMRAYNAGARSVMVVMPTGTGKTLTMAETAREFGVGNGNVVAAFIAHRRELIDQAEKAFRRQLPGARMAMEKGTRQAAARTDVLLASIQSLHDERLEDVISRFEYRLGLVVIDEAHRSAAESYRDVHALVRQRCPDAMIVGFTATPDRTDGVGLADLYDEVVYSYDAAQAIDDGWLVPVTAYRVESDISVDGVATRDGDFVKSKLSLVVNNSERNRRVVHAYREAAMGMRAIAFCAGIDHAEAMARELEDAGVPAVAVHGRMAIGERRRHIAEFEADKYRVLCGADLFIEGFDVPGIECVIMARPTKSSIIYRQSLGRGLRPHEEIARVLGTLSDAPARVDAIARSLKPRCIVIDVADASSDKSIKSAPRLLGVPYRRVAKPRAEPLEELMLRVDAEPPPPAPVVAPVVHVPVKLVEIDVLRAEEQLASAMTRAVYKWMSFGAGVRRMELPEQPIALTAEGRRIEAFPGALAAARNANAPDVVDDAARAVGAARVRFIPVWAELACADRDRWVLRIYEGSADQIGIVAQAEEPDLAPALRRVEALLRARYPLAVPELGDRRLKPPSARMVRVLSERGIEVPRTRGEALDMLGLMYASPLEKKPIEAVTADVRADLAREYADLTVRDDLIGEIARAAVAGDLDALSIQQPWGYAITGSGGTKRIENRVWSTNVRGLFVIHAAKTYQPGKEFEIHRDSPEVSFEGMRRAPRSALVGVARLVDCIRKAQVSSDQQVWAGDDWCFALDDEVVEFVSPVPYRGALRFFRVPGSTILAALRSATIRSARRVIRGGAGVA